MSQRNGEKARFQINRKRRVHQRAKIRALLAASAPPGSEKPAPAAKPRRAKG